MVVLPTDVTIAPVNAGSCAAGSVPVVIFEAFVVLVVADVANGMP